MNFKSLESFFTQHNSATLDTCDQEAIHRSGAVQNNAVFFAAPRKTLKISHWSRNAIDLGFGGQKETSLHDQSIGDILPQVEAEIAELAADDGNANLHIALSETIDAGEESYDAIFCLVGEMVFVEFLPTAHITPSLLKTKLRATQRACASIISAKSFDAAQQIAVEAVRALTGFKRIKIYQFQDDFSGKVVAEARADSMPSYYGLHFPATDIPRQARQLFSILPFRSIASVDDNISPIIGSDGFALGTLDMTWSIGRSVSTMHTAYLRNMGIEASFSSALMDHGKLWGLIACHTDETTTLPFDIWGLVHDIAETVMVRLDHERKRETAAKIAEVRELEASVALKLREKGTIEEVLRDCSDALKGFMNADGFAFQFDGNIYSVGKTPPEQFIRRLIRWASDKADESDYFHSNALHKQWPDAKEHMETSCGVLIQPVIIHRVCQLVWFRGPVINTVHWAGDPTAKTVVKRQDGLDVLQPRNSFKQWVSEHNEQSQDWSVAEINAASEIFKEVLDIIASQAQGLKRMTEELALSQAETREELAQFAYAAAHDIQNPINTITSALELIKTTQGESDDPMVQKSMEFALRSSDRLRGLASQMADFVALGKREIEPEDVALDEVASDALKMLSHAITENGAGFDMDPLPVVAGSKDLLTILFLNLFSNAIKYRKADIAPFIRVTSKSTEKFIQLAVADNGVGIASEDAQRIFNAFDRLHRADEIPGSGLGLATCKRIAELHKTSIILDKDYADGARFTMDFRKSRWTKNTSD